MMAMRRRLGRYTGFLVLAMALAPVPLSAAGDDAAQLLGGLAKFALDTGEPAAALRYTGNLSAEADVLVRARALMATGNGDRARALLEQLAAGQYYRGEAALLLAEMATGNESRETTRKYLQTAANRGHGDTRQQALYRLAETHREAGRTDRAGQVLASMDPGYWAALGYMNIAADYGKRDLNPSRALVA